VVTEGTDKMVKMSEMLEPMPEQNLMIVDALNLAFRWKHSGETDFVDDYARTVASLARSYKSGRVVVAADMKGSTYRREIFPDYKANRKELYADDTPEQKEKTRLFFNEYERVLDHLDGLYTVFRYDGVEADDIAAWIVNHRKELGFDKIWLISSDRDWDLLVDEYTHRFSYVTRKEQTPDTWDNPVPPEQYLCYKCLIGDKGDNIPGVPGVGPKRATALLEQYGSVLDICDQIPLPGKYKYIAAVNEMKDQLMTNIELMDLRTYCDEALGKANREDIYRRMAFEA
jgi:DNA polymerase-1